MSEEINGKETPGQGLRRKKERTGIMKKFFKDFKSFITKGNIVDMAIGVIIGAAFGKIVTSLVNDVIMPLITLAVGGVAVSEWKWVITPAEYDSAGAIIKAESALRYGNFIQTVIDFLIIALFIFIALRIIMTLKTKFEKMEQGIALLNKKEHKALVKEMKAQGKKTEEIKKALQEAEEKKTALLKADEEKKKLQQAEEKAPTAEELLISIRDLLAEQNALTKAAGGKSPDA